MFKLDRKKMKRLRRQSRYTQQLAADAIGGKTYNKIYGIESGKTKNISATDLYILAELYGVSPAELIVKQ